MSRSSRRGPSWWENHDLGVGCKGVTTPRQGVCRNPLPWSGLPGAPPVAAAPPWPRGSCSWRRPTAAVPFAFLSAQRHRPAASQGRLPLGDALPPTTGTLAVRVPTYDPSGTCLALEPPRPHPRISFSASSSGFLPMLKQRPPCRCWPTGLCGARQQERSRWRVKT